MGDINIFIRENIADTISDNLYLSPDIPPKKINNAAKSMAREESIESVIALYDDTLFGSATDGMIFTGEKIIFKCLFEDAVTINYADIKSCDLCRKNEDDKEVIHNFVDITLKDGEHIKIPKMMHYEVKDLCLLIKKIIQEFDSFQEQKQIVPISEMPEKLKAAYLKIIVNMTFFDDNLIDKYELAEIYSLMTRLNLSTEARREMREYINSISEMESVDKLIEEINTSCPEVNNKATKISLVKDLFFVHMRTNNSNHDEFGFFENYKHLFNVSDDEIKIIYETIELDLRMLNDDCDYDEFINGVKELAAKSGAIGIPFAALYLSGSFIGLSSFGFSTWLSLGGLSGLLGFSSALPALGVTILIGWGAYSGIKYLTGADSDIEKKNKHRELMLQEVIKQNQQTISYLMEDINYAVDEANQTILKHGIQDKKIKILMQKMKQLTATSVGVNDRNKNCQAKILKLKCPSQLDESLIKQLTREPTKKKYYHPIISCYEKKQINKLSDDRKDVVCHAGCDSKDIVINKPSDGGRDVETDEAIALKESITLKELETLVLSLDAIGFNNKVNVLQGKLSRVFQSD
ncbi:MAG: hypothetical protein OXC62_05280 [Aestuariivita sp.]|nr:hypothetical protein [Aestuariivita sp.]